MRSIVFLALVLAWSPGPGAAQIFSPGKLSDPHADLEGIRACTSCHQLGQAGISSERCLSCHTPLGASLDRTESLHASFTEPDCATCHKEHLGRDFDVRRLDESAFDHDWGGFALAGSHRNLDCRRCHTDQYVRDDGVRGFKTEHRALSRTFMGLEAACVACHTVDEPHGGQFTSRDCSACHSAETWEDTSAFDHGATAYPLRGAHRTVDCTSCHTSGTDLVRYSPVAFDGCQSCHSDPHQNRMAADCASCHSEDGWRVLSEGNVARTLDHDRTGFALNGAHARLDCVSCHSAAPRRSATVRITYTRATRAFAYPHPESEACTSCHVDTHDGQLSDGPTAGHCASCHGESAWLPTSYGLARHADSDFPLTGAHRTAPCVSCHVPDRPGPQEARFRFSDTNCVACHVTENPHGAEYDALSCEACHSTSDFEEVEFDHEAEVWSAVVSQCTSCHTDDDPHGRQFGDDQCSTCHQTDTFEIGSFDHGRTRLPLDGAHFETACSACHFNEPKPEGGLMVRYRPVDPECAACHETGVLK